MKSRNSGTFRTYFRQSIANNKRYSVSEKPGMEFEFPSIMKNRLATDLNPRKSHQTQRKKKWCPQLQRILTTAYEYNSFNRNSSNRIWVLQMDHKTYNPHKRCNLFHRSDPAVVSKNW
jgi:hypothetical protein